MTRRLTRLGFLVAIALIAASCAAGKAFRQGDAASRAGDLDQAVAQYRAAVHAAPDNPNYKIALQRAMQAASRVHLERAKEFEDKPHVKGGLLAGKKIDNAQLKRLASLPSREQMLADLAAGMQSPMAAFVGALNGLLYMSAGALDALKTQRQGA